MLPTLGDSTANAPRAARGGRCGQCANGEALGFAFSYAYQPIVDIVTREVFAHEALVRGIQGEPAGTILSQVTEENRYRFDQACRGRAIEIAARLGMSSRLSINFLPNAVYRPEVCIRTTLEAARKHQWPVERIIFETVEGERIEDGKWFAEILREYQRIGFLTAIDDFGAGYAGLNLLADFQPDIIKLDMALVRAIHERRAAQCIVRALVDIGASLGIHVVAEGIESYEEYRCLEAMGIRLMQGYLLGRPLFESVATGTMIGWPPSSDSAERQRRLDSDDDVFAGVRVR